MLNRSSVAKSDTLMYWLLTLLNNRKKSILYASASRVAIFLKVYENFNFDALIQTIG